MQRCDAIAPPRFEFNEGDETLARGWPPFEEKKLALRGFEGQQDRLAIRRKRKNLVVEPFVECIRGWSLSAGVHAS